jgi:hypothetical protein
VGVYVKHTGEIPNNLVRLNFTLLPRDHPLYDNTYENNYSDSRMRRRPGGVKAHMVEGQVSDIRSYIRRKSPHHYDRGMFVYT